MAGAGYGCEWGDCTRPPAVLITRLDNGATVSLCAEDYGPGLIPILASELGVDATHFYAHIEKYIKAQVKAAAKELADAQAAESDEQQSTGPTVDDDISGDAVDDQGGMSEVYGHYADDERAER